MRHSQTKPVPALFLLKKKPKQKPDWALDCEQNVHSELGKRGGERKMLRTVCAIQACCTFSSGTEGWLEHLILYPGNSPGSEGEGVASTGTPFYKSLCRCFDSTSVNRQRLLEDVLNLTVLWKESNSLQHILHVLLFFLLYIQLSQWTPKFIIKPSHMFHIYLTSCLKPWCTSHGCNL